MTVELPVFGKQIDTYTASACCTREARIMPSEWLQLGIGGSQVVADSVSAMNRHRVRSRACERPQPQGMNTGLKFNGKVSIQRLQHRFV